MAKTEGEIVGWFTMGGKHIPIYKGQNKAQAYEAYHNKAMAKDREDAKKNAAKRQEEAEKEKNNPYAKPSGPVVKETPELKKSLSQFKEDECWGGRAKLSSYTSCGNTNPNKMDPHDNTTETGYEVYLSSKASNDASTVKKLKSMGFRKVADNRWKLTTSFKKGN